MSQIFSADAQLSGSITVPNTALTSIVSTNPLQPPFQTCKAKVLAVIDFVPGADQTTVQYSITRNIDSEAILVAQGGIGFAAATFSELPLSVAGIDEIPDPRAVSYTLQIAQVGGTDDGNVNSAYIEATLISG
jgi:hypothetical protein